MNYKDSITFDDIEIDLSNHGAQGSTMIDTLDTITITGSGSDQYSNINTITLPSSTFTYGGAGSGLSNFNSNAQWTTGTNGYTFTNATVSSTVNISNTGIDMAAGTDITVDGKSLKEFMKKMEERLAILVPDPKKLEQFTALKKAYEHYKLMEQLCQEPPKEE
jgi:hypothetical protein